MEWSFELSLTIFLIISAVSVAIMIATKSRLSLPFVFGVIIIAGFAFNIFPKDFAIKTKLLEVGTIAFNVLIIHAGTMFDFSKIKLNKNAFIIAITSVIVMSIVVIFGLGPIFGWELALLAPASMLGTGATNAIASIGILKTMPQLSAFPWLLFMFQGFFGLPIYAVMLKKIKGKSDDGLISKDEVEVETTIKKAFHEKIPDKYKSTGYYLGILMILSLLNRWFYNWALADLGISINLTALIIGMVIGQLGLIERAPLKKSDSFGLLMLGLMCLMAQSFANIPIQGVLGLMIPVIVCFIVCTLSLCIVGLALSKKLGFKKHMGVAIAISCMVPMPTNSIIIRSMFGDDVKRANMLVGNMDMGSLYMMNIFSVLLISILMYFI
jgi:hypothetical protein